jgi:excisionase family DNA binding protein
MSSQISPVVLNNVISVKDAAECSGYSLQYIRRLLRCGRLAGLKIGQVWLIEKAAFEAYLAKAIQAKDRRFGPRQNSDNATLSFSPLRSV